MVLLSPGQPKGEGEKNKTDGAQGARKRRSTMHCNTHVAALCGEEGSKKYSCSGSLLRHSLGCFGTAELVGTQLGGGLCH